MREGELILAGLPQADGNLKIRPVLLLKQLPEYSDFLVCGISTQTHHLIKDFDQLIDERSDSFLQTGLRQSSIIRLGFLAVMHRHKISGSIGKIDPVLHRSLLERLAEYLLR